MTEAFLFDSEAFDSEAAAFEAYRRLYAIGSDVDRGGGPFRAQVRAVRLDGLLLFERRLSGVVHARAGRVAQDRFDHFALHLVREGELLGSGTSGFDRAGPGDLLLVDTRKGSRTEARDVVMLTASVPRPTLAAAAGVTDRLHGRIVSAPATAVLADLTASLVRHAGDLEPSGLPGLTRAFLEALTSTLSGLAAPAAARRRADFIHRQRIVRFIAARLGDRDLDATAVAAGVGCSRSSLYRLFAAEGGVAAFIMARRLAAVRDALERGADAPLADLAVAFGFTDESHLNRRFNRAYGMPAGAFRRNLSAEAETGPSADLPHWSGWLSELG